jgi:hypothetical protein
MSDETLKIKKAFEEICKPLNYSDEKRGKSIPCLSGQ